MKDIHCEIRSRPVASGTELVGMVWANGKMMGDYRFTVRSEGAGGSSNIAQSGLFSTEPNIPSILGSVVVSSGAGSSFIARLSITSGGNEVCAAEA